MGGASHCPRLPFAPALLTLSLHITLHVYFNTSRLFILLYEKNKQTIGLFAVEYRLPQQQVNCSVGESRLLVGRHNFWSFDSR